MSQIKLNIRNEYGQLKSALVNDASTIISADELPRMKRLYGHDEGKFIKYHPESDWWRFKKIVELHLISSPLRASLAPARRPHPPRFHYFLRARFLLGSAEHLIY